jgi:hypothetical protein
MADRSAGRDPAPGCSRGPSSRTTTTAATTRTASNVTSITVIPSHAQPDIHPHMGIDMGIDDTSLSPMVGERGAGGCRLETPH